MDLQPLGGRICLGEHTIKSGTVREWPQSKCYLIMHQAKSGRKSNKTEKGKNRHMENLM